MTKIIKAQVVGNAAKTGVVNKRVAITVGTKFADGSVIAPFQTALHTIRVNEPSKTA